MSRSPQSSGLPSSTSVELPSRQEYEDMRGLNKVMVVGNLGADPESRALPSGQTVTSLRVATSEEWKDKETGEKKSRTEWHSVQLFGKVAEIAAEYLKKGSKVYLEGSLRTRKWQDKEGNDRYSTEVIATEMLMLDPPSGGARREEEESPPPCRSPARQQASNRRQPEPESDLGDDDDIPFGR